MYGDLVKIKDLDNVLSTHSYKKVHDWFTNDMIADAKNVAGRTSIITNKPVKMFLQLEKIKNSPNRNEKRDL